ncbi:MAG: ATP-binding protein, partial [Bacteroidaceae bacterium]|nr:ATP-binding protein [Bacteroidaceae bacterium]
MSETYNFTLPHNLKFKDRLRNLFYLNDYLQEYSTIDQNSSFSSFINKIWKKKIQNSGFQKDNIHIEREKCILKIAKERCHTGAFYINAEGLDETALSKLKQDDILGYEDNFGGYFITHDIYEEWALEKIISRDFANFIDANNFFEVLGESLPMRRALRLWLSDKISENIDAVNNFVNDTLSNKNISQFWKDEIIISILLSNYSNAFFAQYESEMTDDNFKLLDRTLFLLRIACTKITGTDNFEDTEIIKTAPIGNGWNTIILFIYQHKEQYFETHLKLILPILSDWVNANKIGDSTHYAGLLALSLVEKRANTKNFYIEKDVEETILKIIYNAAYELQSELKQIFDNVLKNRWVKHNSPYEELCSTILEKPYYGIEVIKTLPESIIQLCDLFWKKTQDEDEKRFPSHSYEMEYRYGLTDKYNFDYFPASALQTPINWLLQVSPKKTIDFIIDFTNYSVECYRQSDYGRENIEEIVLHIDEKKEVKQYLSWALWGMYRGVGSPVVPYLLQSIHMALERFLLELSSTIDSQAIEYVLISILDKSKSASLTAIVCSVVLAYPDKFWKVALILFKTIELFHMDSIRCQNEFEAKSLYSIGGLPQKLFYSEERLKTCQDKHRSTNLESLCVNYQFFGIKGFTEKENNNFIDAIYSIIDNHKSNIQSRIKNEQVTYGILLTRMDRRTMHPTIKEQDDSHTIIELNPELSPELKKHSEDSMNLYNSQMKYITLSLWSKYKSENNTDAVNYPQYDNNPQKALQEAKEILTTIKENATQLMPMDEYIPAFVCAALIRSYSTQLSSQELDFCKNIVLECISMVFDDTYRYQISDGVEACVHALPQIIELFLEESQHYKLILL